MIKDKPLTKAELERQLAAINRDEIRKVREANQALNYKKFKERNDTFLIGRAYCSLSPLESLRITMHVPGNMGCTYEPSKMVTSATKLFFHNLFTPQMQRALQERFDLLVESVIEEYLNNPKCVIEMMGLQSDYHVLHIQKEYPADKVAEIEAEIQEEQFKILDGFTAEQLLAMDRPSHGINILRAYAKARDIPKLANKRY